MTDRPIIFRPWAVRAAWDGLKTQDRRPAWRICSVCSGRGYDTPVHLCAKCAGQRAFATIWQKVRPGDRLWCRESFTLMNEGSRLVPRYAPMYAADYAGFERPERDWKWASPVCMPRWASRMTLLVTATRMERLQEISVHDLLDEGFDFSFLYDPETEKPEPGQEYWREFAESWDERRNEDAWVANPEVVALTFEAHRANIDVMEKAA